MDQRPRDLADPSVMGAAQPILAPGRGLSLPALARAGVTLAGRPVAVDGERVAFDDSLAANVAAGDAFAARLRALADESIRRRGLDAPRPWSPPRGPRCAPTPPDRCPACGTWGCAGCGGAARASSASPGTPPWSPTPSGPTWAADSYRKAARPSAW